MEGRNGLLEQLNGLFKSRFRNVRIHTLDDNAATRDTVVAYAAETLITNIPRLVPRDDTKIFTNFTNCRDINKQSVCKSEKGNYRRTRIAKNKQHTIKMDLHAYQAVNE